MIIAQYVVHPKCTYVHTYTHPLPSETENIIEFVKFLERDLVIMFRVQGLEGAQYSHFGCTVEGFGVGGTYRAGLESRIEQDLGVEPTQCKTNYVRMYVHHNYPPPLTHVGSVGSHQHVKVSKVQCLCAEGGEYCVSRC